MTTIRVRLLTGRYTAGPVLEWPPHPVRLFYAAAAAWGESGGDPAERAALLWWENLRPPTIVCSGPADVLFRDDVPHFVPINDVAVARNLHGLGPRISDAEHQRDVAADGKERAKAARALASLEKKAAQDSAKAAQPRGGASTDLGIMPDNRPKQLRTYPTVRPDNPVIDYRWPDDDVPVDMVVPLSKLLGRVGRLGHSSTFVHCELTLVTDESLDATDEIDSADFPPRALLVPDADGGEVLRIQAADLLDELEIEFETHRGRAPRRLPHGSAAYRWSDDRVVAEPEPWERSDDQWLIMEVESSAARTRWERPGVQPTVNVGRTAELTRAVRGALLSHCREPIPPVLSGHRGDRPNNDPHALILALPNAGNTRSDGSISAVVLAVPAAIKPDDVVTIEEAVGRWLDAGGEVWFGNRALRVQPPRFDAGTTGFDERRYTTTRAYWARPSRTWTTVTPIALDRFPHALRRSGPVDFTAFDEEIAELVGRACTLRGLPVPQAVRAISGSPLVGIPPVRSGAGGKAGFPPYRTEGSRQVRFTTHLQVTFERRVRGPLVLGSGRHFGYGLFLPSDRRRGES